MSYQPQGYGAPPPGGQGYGAPPPGGHGYGAPPPGGQGYGAPPPQGGAPPQGGPPQGGQQGGYGAPPPAGGQPGGYGAPPPQGGQQGGYGAPPPQNGGYGAPPPQGGQQGGYGAPTPQNGGYGAPPPAQGGPPQNGGYGAPPSQAGPPQGGQQGGYAGQLPPPNNQGGQQQGGYAGQPPPPNNQGFVQGGPPSVGDMSMPPPGPGQMPPQAPPQMQQQPSAVSQYGAFAEPVQYAGGASQPQERMAAAPAQPLDASAQCAPAYMRLTCTSIPNSSSIAGKAHVPLGLVIRPLAPSPKEEDPAADAAGEGGSDIDVVSFGSAGIVRCKRCRAYINPFVSWVDNGRRWRCNLCGMLTDVPSSYFCHLDSNGMRRDREQRPELSCGSVELVAPAEYMVRPPQAPVYVFLIDVSSNAVQSGMLQACCETIAASLDLLPGAPRTQVAVVTFDSAVHFYNLKASLNAPQMLVVPDIADLFLPVPDDLLVNLADSKHLVVQLLESLPAMFAASTNVEACLGPALVAAQRVMSHIGGKLCVFQSCLPTFGEARLRHREDPRLFGSDQEHQLFSPQERFYKDKAEEFSRAQISCELFLFSNTYTDVATLGALCKHSAGQLYHYPGYGAHLRSKFAADLGHTLSRETGFEAVMRVRCTRGMRITNFYGNYLIRGTDLLALPNCTSESTFAVELAHDDTLLTANIISVQAALLYTTSSGERRIRVHTLAAPVTSVFADVFLNADVDAVCNLLAKQALDVALRAGLASARDRLQQRCIDIIRAYRSVQGAAGHMQQPGQQQLYLPESMQLLPLYTMALQKSIVFRGGSDVRSDERVAAMHALGAMPVEMSRVFIYPRLFSLADMPDESGRPAEPGDGAATAGSQRIRLPPVVNLSAERLSSEGVFLLEDSLGLYLWWGRGVSPVFAQSVLNVPSVDGVDLSQIELPRLDNDLSARVNAIVDALRDERPYHLHVAMLREGDPAEGRFFIKLVEDRASYNGGSMNYNEYLNHVNRQSHGVTG